MSTAVQTNEEKHLRERERERGKVGKVMCSLSEFETRLYVFICMDVIGEFAAIHTST